MSDANNVFRPIYKDLSDEEKKLMEDVKNKAMELYSLMGSAIKENPSSKARYISLAKTTLEESVMWAVKGITT